MSLSVIVFELVFLPTLAYALLCGGRSERAVIIVLATAFTATPLLVANRATAFEQLEYSMPVVSGVSFLLLLAISLRTSKFWPLWVTALQGMVLIGYVAPLLSPQVGKWTYYMAHTSWSYFQLFLVAIGTWEHNRYKRVSPTEPG